jgi:hypothetical protein
VSRPAQTGATPTVALHVWRLPGTAVPAALWRMAVDRGRLRRTPGVAFAKLLGTGRGSAFGPLDADPRRWAALVVWRDGPPRDTAVTRAWDRLAEASCRLTLRPVASRGTWAGAAPFQPTARDTTTRDTTTRDTTAAPLLVLTRARLRVRRAPEFWQAIPLAAGGLADAPGLHAAFGVGEAPVGFQGTVSVWRGPADIARFAYRQPEHAEVVARTGQRRWYAEELFARFTVVDVAGDRGVIGWRETAA